MCTNFRKIALAPHASTVLLRMIQNRIVTFMIGKMSAVEQTKARETIDQVANIRWIMEKSNEYRNVL